MVVVVFRISLWWFLECMCVVVLGVVLLGMVMVMFDMVLSDY